MTGMPDGQTNLRMQIHRNRQAFERKIAGRGVQDPEEDNSRAAQRQRQRQEEREWQARADRLAEERAQLARREAAEAKLREIAAAAPDRVKCADMAKIVAAYFGIKPAVIKQKDRRRNMSAPRHLTFWVMHRLYGRSLHEVGMAFDRDHTTVLHAAWRVDAVIQELGLDYGKDATAWIEALTLAHPWPNVRHRGDNKERP